ncbi:hypothetical protein STANM309S_04970 [Streptomyces tanashiensis]
MGLLLGVPGRMVLSRERNRAAGEEPGQVVCAPGDTGLPVVAG